MAQELQFRTHELWQATGESVEGLGWAVSWAGMEIEESCFSLFKSKQMQTIAENSPS